MSHDSSDFTDTRVAAPPRDAAILVVAVGLFGALVCAAAPWLANWALTLPWVPFGGPLRLLQALGESVAWWVLGLIGMVIGVVAGLVIHAGEPVITVSDRAIVVTKGDQRTRVARSQVTVAAIENRHLVLRDHADVELADEKLDAGVSQRVAEALYRHGWSR
jgi:hypothetical protein